MITLNAGTIKVGEWNSGDAPILPPIPPPPFEIIGITATPAPRTVGGAPSEQTIGDGVFNVSTEATVYDDRQCLLYWRGVAPAAPFVWSSSNPEVASVDQQGFVTHHTTGDVRISVNIEGGGGRYVDLNLVVRGGSSSRVLLRYLDGSLAKHVTDAVDSRIAGKSAATAKKLFTTQTHATAIYVRNPNAWCADLGAQLGSISPWNESGGPTRAGVLISPIHILFAAHYQINSGAKIRFIKPDGTVVERIMVSKKAHPQFDGLFPDIAIGLLSSPILDIPFAKCLPQNYRDYLPNIDPNPGMDATLPALCLDQDEDASISDLYRVGVFPFGVTPGVKASAVFMPPVYLNWEKRNEFYEVKRGGDSGNPAFLIINNALVLLCVWTFGGAGVGTDLVQHKAAIDLMMSQLGGGYTMTEVDLSGFPTYP